MVKLFYEDEMLTEKGLIEQLLVDVVISTFEINREGIKRAINYTPSSFQREMVYHYINYFEVVVESLE